MAKHLKLFDLTAEYQAYVNGPNMILPNVSVCKDNDNTVYYHPTVITPEGGGSGEPSVDVLQGAKILCKYNVSDTSSPIILYHSSSGSGSGNGSAEVASMFSSMEVDGVEQSEVTNKYTFNTTGEHTVLFTLSEGVTSISENAFKGCDELTNVTIGNSVTSIGSFAFQNCSKLTSITIPNSVISIGSFAFHSCSELTSITIPDSVTLIGECTFGNCFELTSVTIPNSVTLIGDNAFNTCSKLTSITIPNSVTSIGYDAFYACGLTSITIPNSVTSIGQDAFAYCQKLISITIGNSVTSIGQDAFFVCDGLTSIICNATTAPTIQDSTFTSVKTGGTLTVPAGSTGYDVWMGTGDYYLGKYNWTKVEV